eukprot:11157611-Lingulodinium_polyedra.AAC.1
MVRHPRLCGHHAEQHCPHLHPGPGAHAGLHRLDHGLEGADPRVRRRRHGGRRSLFPGHARGGGSGAR